MTQNSSSIQLRVIPVTPLQQNCSMLWDSETMEGVFVDPGGDWEKLKGIAEEAGVAIKEMWLTHGHLDHAGGAEDLRATLNIPVIGPHKEDLFWLEQIEAQYAKYGMPGLGKNVVPDRYLEDGDVLKLGKTEFNVVHTPGHTPGHVVIYNQDLKIAFVGDVLFRGSIGRTDFPRGDYQTLIDSITDKLWPLGGDMRFIPGHGPASTFAQERASNQFVADSIIGTVSENTDGVM